MTETRYVIGPIPGLPKNPNQLKGQHWSAYHKEAAEWQRSVGLMALVVRNRYGLRPLPKAALHFHVSVGDNRTHDADNIIASFKPVLDALKGVIIEDDSIDHIQLSYSFDRAKPRQFTIQVIPLAAL